MGHPAPSRWRWPRRTERSDASAHHERGDVATAGDEPRPPGPRRVMAATTVPSAPKTGAATATRPGSSSSTVRREAAARTRASSSRSCGAVGDGLRRQRRERAGRQHRGAVGQEHLADGRAWRGTRAADPVRRPEQEAAVDLCDLLDPAARRHSQVHGLAGDRGQPPQPVGGATRRGSSRSLREAYRRGPGAQRTALASHCSEPWRSSACSKREVSSCDGRHGRRGPRLVDAARRLVAVDDRRDLRGAIIAWLPLCMLTR